MKKVKMKKKPIIIILIILLIGIGVFLFIQKLNNDKKIKEIKKYYHEFVTTKAKADLYNKDKKKIGTIVKDIYFELEKMNIKSTKDAYFKIKDTDYYLYYSDTKEAKKKDDKEKQSDNYVLFNKNIEISNKTSLYKEDKDLITITGKVSIPIESMDNDNYYVRFLNDTYKVKKDKSIKEVDSNNTKEKTSDHVSVLFYEFIEGSCNDYNCTTNDNFKNQINKLKESGYYTVTNEEFKNYVSGKKNLKEKAIYITIANYNENTENLKKELQIEINKLEEDAHYRFISTYKPAKANADLKRIDRYQIKTYTTVDDIVKMANGEEVKQSTDDEVNRQGVPVLNYHFFYDATTDVCSETICLDTAKFREQLQYLKDNNFKTLTMEEYRKWMYGEIEVPSKTVLLTVDDGAAGTGKHNGNKLNPLLEEYKLNATLFLITAWWDIENYRGDYLDIQSHGHDVHEYGTCGRGRINCYSYEEAKADLQKSLDIIKNDDSFCFPFYMTSETSIKAVKDAGFKLSFIGGSVPSKRTNNKWLIPRYPIMSYITLDQFINMVN